MINANITRKETVTAKHHNQEKYIMQCKFDILKSTTVEDKSPYPLHRA